MRIANRHLATAAARTGWPRREPPGAVAAVAAVAAVTPAGCPCLLMGGPLHRTHSAARSRTPGRAPPGRALVAMGTAHATFLDFQITQNKLPDSLQWAHKTSLSGYLD